MRNQPARQLPYHTAEHLTPRISTFLPGKSGFNLSRKRPPTTSSSSTRSTAVEIITSDDNKSNCRDEDEEKDPNSGSEDEDEEQFGVYLSCISHGEVFTPGDVENITEDVEEK